MTAPTPDPDAIATLRQSPLLAGFDPAHLARLLAAGRRRDVVQGERLIRAGDSAEDMFLVLRGRFTVLSKGQPIADIGAGEPIGEIAFFAGGTRSADVVAARGGSVLVLDRPAWTSLTRDVPQIHQAILASLAQRLAATSRAAPALRPLAARAVAFVGAIPDAVRAALGPGLPGWAVIGPDAPDPRATMLARESAGHRVLLVEPPADLLGETDEVFDFAALAEAPTAARPLPPSAAVTLVLWRPATARPIAGSAPWLALRAPRRHLHLALDAPGDLARLLRFVEGRALGLVLSGGGAQGTAHLGALKALGEHGVTFDMVGGTSAGAAMGAALALGRDPDQVMALCEDVFLRSRAMGRYTLPRYSVLDPGLYDGALRRHFGAHPIEDLPLPYFAVATNLSRNDVTLLDRGPLWQAVRASTSIPVVFPPWITQDGDILVDGAMIDNAPIQAMRAQKPGPSLLLNMVRDTHWPSAVGYDRLPGRAGVAWQVLTAPLRRRGRDRAEGFPLAIAVLGRVFNVNAQRRLRSIDAPGDVIVDIRPLPGMGFLEWPKARAQFQASYRSFSTALSQARALGHGPEDPVPLLAAMKAALLAQAQD